MTTALRRLGNIVAGLILGAAIVTLVATQVLGYRLASIASDSMQPTLAPGDLILTRPVPINDIEHDDIVLFETGVTTPILVAHRVANIITVNVNVTDSTTGEKHTEQTQILRTKGDANTLVDPEPVDGEHYRGELWVSFPGAGFILASPLPFLLIAVGLGLLWFTFELLGLGRRARSRPVDETGPST